MELTYQQSNDPYTHVFSCCIPVKGHTRGAIYDIQREDIELVPNTMIDFLDYIHRKKRSEILQEFKNDKTAKQYIDFLEKKEFIFYSSNSYFPELPARSINEDTSVIYCATIIFSDFISENLEKIIENINELGVKRLHLHIADENCMNIIKGIFQLLEYSRITNLSFSIPYQKIDKELYLDKRLKTLYLYNSPKEGTVVKNEVSSIFLAVVNDNNLFLPKFSLNTVSINTNTYNIAKQANLALYKTIFIDRDGIIKFNSLDNSNYGNISAPIQDIKTRALEKLSLIWDINKNDITPCNVCEFRLCCTVTHIPVKKNNRYEIECNYNPYTNEFNY